MPDGQRNRLWGAKRRRNGATNRDCCEPWLTNVTVYLYRGLTGGVSSAVARLSLFSLSTRAAQ